MNYIYKRLKGLIAVARPMKAGPSVSHVKIHGHEMLVLENEDVGRQIVTLGVYEENDACYLLSNIKSNAVCFDVGANVGYYTLLMAKNAPEGSVHAFEPVPLNHHLLSASMLINGYENISINRMALGASDGVIEFSQSSDGAYSSIYDVGRKREKKKISVPITTIDHYVEKNKIRRIDVMKVDVEGAEKMVLDCAKNIMSNREMRPTLVMLELFDQNFKPYNTSVDDVIGLMKCYGYSPYYVDRAGVKKPFDSKLSNIFVNIFFE